MITDPSLSKKVIEAIFPLFIILSIGIIVASGIDRLMKWYKKKKLIKNESIEKTTE